MGLVVMVMSLGSRAMAESPGSLAESAPVALDWSRVPDPVVERCKLVGYRGVLTDKLVREGHPIVDRVGEDGIQVIVSATSKWIILAARYRGVTKKRRVRIPRPCESTLIIDLSHELVQTVRLVKKVAPPKPEPKPVPKPKPKPKPQPPVPKPHPRPAVPDTESPDRFELKAGLSSVIPGSPDALVGARVGATFTWHRFSVGVGASIAWHPGEQLTIWEPGGSLSLAVALFRNRLLRFRAGIEGTLLHHGFSHTRSSGGKLDGRFGVLMELAIGHWLLFELLPYLRIDHIDHLLGDQVLYESQHVGILASVSFRILRL